MNTEIQQNNTGSGNWVAFLFGAILNLIVSIDYMSHVDYAIHMLIAGLVWLLFKKLGELKIGKSRKNSLKRLHRRRDNGQH